MSGGHLATRLHALLLRSARARTLRGRLRRPCADPRSRPDGGFGFHRRGAGLFEQPEGNFATRRQLRRWRRRMKPLPPGRRPPRSRRGRTLGAQAAYIATSPSTSPGSRERRCGFGSLRRASPSRSRPSATHPRKRLARSAWSASRVHRIHVANSYVASHLAGGQVSKPHLLGQVSAGRTKRGKRTAAIW
jgi:hypothetical protein